MNNYEWIEQSKLKLEKVDLPFSTLSLLIDYCFEVSLNGFLFLEIDDYSKIDELLNETLKKEKPVSQIVGYEIFYGYKIKVTKDVLIPRVETEELVSLVIKEIKEKYTVGSIINIADICTGSGVIGLVIYEELKKYYDIRLTVSDISISALRVASSNFESYNAEVKMLCGDLLQPFLEEDVLYDIVISNPPYIPNDTLLESIVLDNEPHIALFGGQNGYETYFKIINQVEKIIKSESQIYFEIGDGQGAILFDYISNKLNCNVDVMNDLFGRERIIKIKMGE